jgi:hypothetical protein
MEGSLYCMCAHYSLLSVRVCLMKVHKLVFAVIGRPMTPVAAIEQSRAPFEAHAAAATTGGCVVCGGQK